MEKIKKQNGITLIALVITIIVLLILAGVAVSLLSSDRSAMQGAQEASSEYSIGASEEKSLVDKMNNKIDEYKSDGGEEEPVVDGTSAEDIIADITENENASEYYGKYVTNYDPDIETDVQWRIFYIGPTPGGTENNIYLIADHYVARTQLPAAYGTSTLPNRGNDSDGLRTAYFTNVIGTYSSGTGSIGSDNLARNWLSIYWEALNGSSSVNNNMQAVAYMMDTRVWNKFNDVNSNNEEIAKYVIGGPTLEMFTTSWNQIYGEEQELAPAANTTGYSINGSYNVSGLIDSTNLWIPSAQYNANVTTDYTEYTEKEAYGMWFASPSYYDIIGLIHMDYLGSVDSSSYGSPKRGFRPIVCLKSGIQLSTNDEGATYQIVK